MSAIFLPGSPPIEVAIRRSARSRRLSLRISRTDNSATLTMPVRVPKSEAEAFVRAKESWLRKHIDAAPDITSVGLGANLPVEGIPVAVTLQDKGPVRLTDGGLWVSGRPEQVGTKVAAFLKLLARDRLIIASEKYASQVNRSFSKITLRDTKSRWGSCSSDRALMYSWRLILAPPEVLDYVAAHEVAHLVEMNHGPQFWGLVQKICPDYAAHRAWLRQNGADLHRYRFDR